MTTYFIPEIVSASVGKGNAMVINLLHHFLENLQIVNPDDDTDTAKPVKVIIWADNW